MLWESFKAFLFIILLLAGAILTMFLLMFYTELVGYTEHWLTLPVVVLIIFLTLKKRRR
jgi:hypothetical protein